jgi:hypothetical protein
MSDLQDLLGIIGSVGNSAGVKGDGPTGLNAIQRASLPTEQQSALAQLNARANTDFSNPQGAIQQMYKSGNVAGNDALTALANPMLQSGTGIPSPSQPANPAQPQARQLDAEGIDQNYLNSQVPPFYRNQVTDVIKGGELPKDISPKDRTLIMNMAHNAAPDFSESVGINRSKTVADFSSSGKSGQALTSAGIGTKHLAQWFLSGLDLHNAAVPLIGSTINGMKNSYANESGQDPITTFNSVAGTVAPEIAKAANSGGEVTDADKNTQRGDLGNSSASPQQMAATAAAKATLLSSKGQEMGATYRKNMGPINPGFTPISKETAQTQSDLAALHSISKIDPYFKSKQAQVIIQRVRDAVALPDDAYMPTIHAGNGTSALSKPDVSAPPTPPKYQEGATYTSKSTGKKFIIKNGQPMPMGGQ